MLLATDADLRSLLLVASHVDAKGETRGSYDMTKDGFTLLVMGYTGAKALQFKFACIAKFNEME